MYNIIQCFQNNSIRTFVIMKSPKNSSLLQLMNFFIIFSFCIQFAFSQSITEQKKILLIGNSLTYYNDMGKMLSEMFYKSNLESSVYEISKPGVWLKNHYLNLSGNGDIAISKDFKKGNKDNNLWVKLDKNEHWDWVILQDAPVRMLIPQIKEAFFERYSKRIDSLVKNSGGRSILFLPYTVLQKYPFTLCQPASYSEKEVCLDNICCSDTLNSSDDELKIYINAVEKLRNENGFAIAPVGIAFDKVAKLNLDINLFADNEGHPSELGSFLMACIYFQTITGFEPKKIEPVENINYESMNKLIEVSKSCF